VRIGVALLEAEFAHPAAVMMKPARIALARKDAEACDAELMEHLVETAWIAPQSRSVVNRNRVSTVFTRPSVPWVNRPTTPADDVGQRGPYRTNSRRSLNPTIASVAFRSRVIGIFDGRPERFSGFVGRCGLAPPCVPRPPAPASRPCPEGDVT
jgi:hypothetical protein